MLRRALLLATIVCAVHKDWEPPARIDKPRIASPSWVRAPRLLHRSMTTVVANLTAPRLRYARYFTLVTDAEPFLVARNGANRGATAKVFSEIFPGCDASLECVHRGKQLVPGPESENTARNLAMWRGADGGVFGVGGEAGDVATGKVGATLLHAPSLESLASRGWRAVHLFDATGCIERYFETCRFDSKFSVAELNGTIVIYARANLNARGGGRQVQAARAERISLESMLKDSGSVAWRPFELVTFDGDDYDPTVTSIYLFAVNANPVVPASLLALYTLVNEEGSFVALSASLDGVRFTAPSPIIETESFYGSRALDQPVDGLWFHDGVVYFYMHTNVQGIAGTARNGFPSHLARYAMRADALRSWTRAALQELIEA